MFYLLEGIMRKTVLVASWGMLFLLGADHASAEYLSLPVHKLCEAGNVNAGTPTADAPTEPGTEKEQAKPTRSAEDIVLSERLQDLIANRLQQYVARPQDRTAVEAFYRGRDFAPLWVNAAGALPSTLQAVDFLHGVAADGLDPKDYPTPTFADRDPTRLAVDELALTNSIATFMRHASTGRPIFHLPLIDVNVHERSPLKNHAHSSCCPLAPDVAARVSFAAGLINLAWMVPLGYGFAQLVRFSNKPRPMAKIGALAGHSSKPWR